MLVAPVSATLAFFLHKSCGVGVCRPLCGVVGLGPFSGTCGSEPLHGVEVAGPSAPLCVVVGLGPFSGEDRNHRNDKQQHLLAHALLGDAWPTP